MLWSDGRTEISNNVFSERRSTSWRPRNVENALIWKYMRRFQLSGVVGTLNEKHSNNARPLHPLLFCRRNHPRPPANEVKGFVDHLAGSVIASKSRYA